MLLMCVLMLVSSGGSEQQVVDEGAPVIQEAKVDEKVPPPQLEPFDPTGASLDPKPLTTESLTWTKAGSGSAIDQKEIYFDDSPEFSPEGGGSLNSPKSGPLLGGDGGDIRGIFSGGPAVAGSGVGVGPGEGLNPGSGGKEFGFSTRKGNRKAMIASGGGTQEGERAVAAALSWLARHQLSDGGWSLEADGPHGYRQKCKDNTCTGGGNARQDAGATALALLPFLAAGQTHDSKGPYQQTIKRGIWWLMYNQRPNGDLTFSRHGDMGTNMYAHGLATITLCEACGMVKASDWQLREKAQRAVNFIISAQNASTGGWRYTPGEDGDTSVVGWQVMALKSAQMAGLSVNPKAFEGAKQFLKSCSRGNYGGVFWYRPESQGMSEHAMTSVGLLCYQYMGSRPGDPMLVEGQRYLMSNLPDPAGSSRDLYYWYYATQVMHNMLGPDWDAWNRKMRHTLIETQTKEGCAMGSWEPNRVMTPLCSGAGGRLMATSLSALTLEVYYRYLPLFKLDAELAAKPAAGGDAPAPPPAAEKAASNK
jgi:hypothetical protein